MTNTAMHPTLQLVGTYGIRPELLLQEGLYANSDVRRRPSANCSGTV